MNKAPAAVLPPEDHPPQHIVPIDEMVFQRRADMANENEDQEPAAQPVDRVKHVLQSL